MEQALCELTTLIYSRDNMTSIENFIKPNTAIRLEAKNEIVKLTQYEKSLELRLNKSPIDIDIDNVLENSKGPVSCVLNSDILGLSDKIFKLKRLEIHTMHRLLTQIIKSSIPLLSEIAQREKKEIMIQSTINNLTPSLTISAGIIDDIQVLLLDLRYLNKKEAQPC